MIATLMIFAACHAIDADTLRCGDERIRLARIDAKELSEPEGPKAKEWMRVKVEGKQVTCTVYGREKYQRLLADCFTQPGPSLSDQALAEGIAVPYRLRNRKR